MSKQKTICGLLVKTKKTIKICSNIQKTEDCFNRAHIGHRLHLTHLILIRIQFISITRLKSPKFYELSENHVEAHLSEVYIFFQMLCFKAWPLN